MDDILLLDAIERYLSGEMSAEERNYFENLRKTTPEIDQMVVEHNMFLTRLRTMLPIFRLSKPYLKFTSICWTEET